VADTNAALQRLVMSVVGLGLMAAQRDHRDKADGFVKRRLPMFTNFWSKSITDWSEYCRDTAERSMLFMDIVRKRGNIYLEHLRKDQPPVLVFKYETILDGRTFERPVNYALVCDTKSHNWLIGKALSRCLDQSQHSPAGTIGGMPAARRAVGMKPFSTMYQIPHLREGWKP